MLGYGIAMGWFYINPSLGWQKKGWWWALTWTKINVENKISVGKGTKGGLSLVFGLGNVLKCFYKTSSLCWRNIVWWWGLCITLNITQLITNCSKYVLLQRKTSQMKHCKKPMDLQICTLKEWKLWISLEFWAH